MKAASIADKARQIVAAAERIGKIGDQVAVELGVTDTRLELELGRLDEDTLGPRGLRFRIRVDTRWFDLPRGLDRNSDEEISDAFRKVLQGRGVAIDFTELNEAISKLRPARKGP